MRCLALDVGTRRIGLAMSESGVFAKPHGVLHRKSKKEDFARLSRLITELKIERVIVGLPYPLNGQEEMGPQARQVKRYAEALAEVIPVPLEYFDESYSTVDAQAQLSTSGQKKVPIDAAAATIILQNYLDTLRNKPSSGEEVDGAAIHGTN
jgi:putative holliday junction resolvase